MFPCMKLRYLIYELLEGTFKNDSIPVMETHGSMARIITVQCKDLVVLNG